MAWFKDFDRLTPFIAAFRPAIARSLEATTKDTFEQMTKNWEQGQDTMGRPWAPNAPNTIGQKNGSTPLIDTRQMIDSAEYNVDRGELSAQITIEDDEQKVLAHEYGVPDQGIPARPILAPTKEYMEQESGSILKKGFDKAWARATVSGSSVQVGFGGDS